MFSGLKERGGGLPFAFPSFFLSSVCADLEILMAKNCPGRKRERGGDLPSVYLGEKSSSVRYGWGREKRRKQSLKLSLLLRIFLRSAENGTEERISRPACLLSFFQRPGRTEREGENRGSFSRPPEAKEGSDRKEGERSAEEVRWKGDRGKREEEGEEGIKISKEIG